MILNSSIAFNNLLISLRRLKYAYHLPAVCLIVLCAGQIDLWGG